jgi:hypothetical protein
MSQACRSEHIYNPAGNTEIVIPVSCVEQGRWRYDSNEFSSGRKMMHASLRRSHQEDVKSSLKRGHGYRSDQGKIWGDIEEKLDRMNVAAPTSAMSDAYESYEDRLSDYLEKFSLIEWQFGAVFAINGQVLGLECFGCSDTFAGFFDRLVKSYALDALDWLKDSKEDSVAPEKARRFIQSTSFNFNKIVERFYYARRSTIQTMAYFETVRDQQIRPHCR